MSQIYGGMGIPLTIILRAHTLVDPDMLSETYSNTDIDYMRTFKLEREAYDTDNIFLNIFKQLVIDGPGWTYINQFGSKKYGRGAYQALTIQAEGSAALKQRKKISYNSINIARFLGTSRTWTLD